MKLALIAFTRRGLALAQGLRQALENGGDSCSLHVPPRLAGDENPPAYESLQRWTEGAFACEDGLIFVGACGIAVRAIAPCLRDKFTDPAVVAVDEAGAWTLPLLSGHVGGANDLALRVAVILGGQAAISTATDVNGMFAVDAWANSQGLVLCERTLAKKISAALLEGAELGFASEFPAETPLPLGFAPGPHGLGFAVTLDEGSAEFPETLHLIPQILHLGIGCRRGVAPEAIGALIDRVLAEHGLSTKGVRGVETIDLKQNEPGLLAFCAQRNWPLVAHSASALAAVPGAFTASDFVARTTGVDNVCERAAAFGGRKLLVKKQAADGVTVAIAAEAFALRFEEEEP